MNHEGGLVIVVSKLGERERLFFSRWGLKDPEDSPYVRYLSEDACECSADNSIMVLIRGDLGYLPDRVVLATRATQVAISDSFLLVHTGDAQEMRKAIAGKLPSAEFSSEWEALLQRSFSLRSDEEPYLIIRNELASYAAAKQNTKFWEAFIFLKQALSDALSLHAGGAESAEIRSKAALVNLDSQTKRINAGLPASKPRPRLNPISALIHDVVSRFDALLIDLQTSIEDESYWTEEKARYKGSIGDYLDRLKTLLTESDTGVTDLETVPHIATRIIQSDRITEEDRIKLQETTADLEKMAPDQGWQSAFKLLNAINEGTHPKVIQPDYDALRLWLNTLRQKLTVLDDLFKKSRPPAIHR